MKSNFCINIKFLFWCTTCELCGYIGFKIKSKIDIITCKYFTKLSHEVRRSWTENWFSKYYQNYVEYSKRFANFT